MGEKIVAINGTTYDADALRAAIRDARGTNEPIVLTMEQQGRVWTTRIDYHDGLRYPHLERTSGPARLDDILAAR